MRFLALRLLAFGHFSDASVDLAAPGPALHLVYGPNEAGKSTALRAITGFLYDIPQPTPDAHRHEAGKLRVGAELCFADGRVVELVRRKGRKDTLLGPDGKPADSAALEAALAGVGEAVFRQVFGLDHDGLRAGAQALLADRGDVGESLYDAALGGGGLHPLRAALVAEAEELYRPRAPTARLNRAVADYRTARKAADAAALEANGWRRQREGLSEAERARDVLRQRRRDVGVETLRLERVRRALPHFARHASLAAARRALGEVPPVPPDAAARRSGAVGERDEGARQEARLRAATVALEAALRELDPPGRLVALSVERANALGERLQRQRLAAQDLPGRRAELVAAETSVRAVLRRLRLPGALEDAERHVVDDGAAAHTRGVAIRIREAEAELQRGERALAEAEERRGHLCARLGGLGPARDLAAIAAALASARLTVRLERELVDARARAEALATRGARRAAALAWPLAEALAEAEPDPGHAGRLAAELGRVASLPVPSREALELAASRAAHVAERRRNLAERERQAAGEARRVAGEQEALERAGDVPSEADLEACRARRDALLRAAAAGERTAWSELLLAVSAADALADRLRREADRVALSAGLAARQRESRELAAALATEASELATELAAHEAAWRALWAPSGLAPAEPAAMRAWLDRHAELVRLADELAEASAAVSSLAAALEGARQTLGAALAAEGAGPPDTEPLGALVARADELERRARAEHATRGELESEIGALEAQLATRHERQRGLVDALAQARADFRDAAQRIGLGPDASLEEAEAVLDTLGVLGSELDKLRERRAQVAELERAGTELEREVRALCEAHAPDLVGTAAGPTEAERMASGLLERSARARRELEDRTRLAGELAARRAELAEVAERRLAAVAVLEQLCVAAGVANEVELERAETRAAEARELDRALEETWRALGEIGDGTSVEALRAEAEGHESVAVAERLLELADESAELEAEVEQATDAAVRLRLGLERYEHEQGAVDLANEAEQRLAWVERSAARFVRVRLATLVLDREIERYRRANQGPVVARAAELLGALTTGSLVDLGVEYAADDTAHLVCLRPGGTPVAVEALSDGARDQLFLALRLATLERFLERATEPLPLVLDDVLIHFDDERARAALGVLADFAAQTQVLFFTHHARLRDIARELAAEPRHRGRIFEALLPATLR